MILKALCDYYDRRGDLPPYGWETKEIAFLIVIDKDGHFMKLEDRRQDKHAQRFLVVEAVQRSSNIAPNILWDNVEYVLGFSKQGKSKASEMHRAFVGKCHELASKYPENMQFAAVSLFYDKQDELPKVFDDELWEDIKKMPSANLSFLIKGELKIVAEDKTLEREFHCGEERADEEERLCLITGKMSHITKTFRTTPIVGAKATAKLVSFQVNCGYDSYGKKQGDNAPISEDADFKYATAHKELSGKDSKNKFVCGDRTFLFWASAREEAAGKEAEEGIFALLNFKEKDNPDNGIAKAREIFKAIYSGTIKTALNDRFCFLGLAPNAARIAVVYWNECPLAEFAGNILRHFDDMEVVAKPGTKPYYGLYSILSAVTRDGKQSEVQPNLPESVFKSIAQGYPYPSSLFSACIRRIRAEQKVYPSRAAIIKAYLNRNKQEKIKTMIDEQNKNSGYLCGRLFAVLEKEQHDANGSSNIGERYMNSASATPAAVFATLLNLNIHHEEKLIDGRRTYYSRLKSEIINALPAAGFPTHLSIEDQGRFFIGYYQQRYALWSRQSGNVSAENNELQ